MPGWETIAVAVIVGAALIWGGRTAWRALRSGKVCADCADSGNCPLARNPQLLEQISREGKLALLDKCGPGGTSCAELAARAERAAAEAAKAAGDRSDRPSS